MVFIINAKRELPTLRLKKLIENLTAYCFVIRFLKGKEMHISDFLSRHRIEDGESPHEIIHIAFQMIEQIIKLEENEKGELCWATDYEQDVLYINSLKDENVINLFMAVFEEVNKGDLKVHNLCNSEMDPVVNPIRKSPLLRKSEAYVSNDIDNHNQYLDKAKPNNQPVEIKGSKTDLVANPIKKSKRSERLSEVINEHEDFVPSTCTREKIPYKDIQDQCFIAATRSRSKEASEKVPGIFPLQGEHRKPEHVHKSKKVRVNQPIVMQFRDNIPPVVQLPPQNPRNFPQDIDQNEEVVNQIPVQKRIPVSKEKKSVNSRAFQLPK